jgi:hypothetical protein
MAPSQSEWDLSEIRKRDRERADLLESAPSFDEFVARMIGAFGEALETNRVRLGTDCWKSKWRCILQFAVPVTLYDGFFNSRTGYRSQYWLSENVEIAADRAIAQALDPILSLLSEEISVREIAVRWGGYEREDVDVGKRLVGRSFIKESLTSPLTKTWICERLIRDHVGPLTNLSNELWRSAIKLKIPRWPTACAPFPAPDSSWIDVKGAFINGSHEQPKRQDVRARELNVHGSS